MLKHATAWTLITIVAVVLFVAALLTTQVGVDLLTGELVARSGGALEIDEVTGTLVGTVRAKRITWRGKATKVEATDVALTWNPVGIFRRGIVLGGLGARALTIDVEPSGSAASLPESLALPIDVLIERLAVGSLTWRVGTGHGMMEGLEFAYRGGAAEHRMSDLRVVTRVGTLTGNATLGASSPFPLAGTFGLQGDESIKNAQVNLAAAGTLSSLALDLNGRAAEGHVFGHATIAPLASVPLVALELNATDVDLAAWNSALPQTRIAAKINAQPADGGVAGTVAATNERGGELSGGRTPLRAFSAHFAWRADAVEFDEIAAELEGDAKATGKARIALGGPAASGSFVLDVRDLDAHQLYAPLVSTRLAGRLSAELTPERRNVSGNLVDGRFPGGVAVDFAATFDERTLDLTRLVARASGGVLAGSGRIGLDGERAFAIDATATHFDPSRFGAYPAGSLDGKIKASGALKPEWRVAGDVTIAPGSRLYNAPLQGSAHGSAAPNRLRNATIDLTIGTATLQLNGSIGEPDDRIAATFDAPHLAQLVPFLPAAIPRALDGAVARERADGGRSGCCRPRCHRERNAAQGGHGVCAREARCPRLGVAVDKRPQRFRGAITQDRHRGPRRHDALGRRRQRQCARDRDAGRTFIVDRARWRRHRSRCDRARRPAGRRRRPPERPLVDRHRRFAGRSRALGVAPQDANDACARATQGARGRSASRGCGRHARHRRIRVGRGKGHLARALCGGADRGVRAPRGPAVADALDADTGR